MGISECGDTVGAWIIPNWIKGLFATSILFLIHLGTFQTLYACGLVDPPEHIRYTLWIHVEGPCLPGQRQDYAVQPEQLLSALAQGHSLDLKGVVIAESVMLDQLPLQDLSSLPDLPSSIRARFQEQGLEKIRVIAGSVHIRDAQFEKVLATNLVDGALVVLGEVNLSQSVFDQSVDFSRTVFAESVTFSEIEVNSETFFIGAQFDGPVDFSQVTFGTHTRFHKAQFHDAVTFSGARFMGVAEFLEVAFRNTAAFPNTFFAGGTGFSGSIFSGPADFSRMKAKYEVYFRFSTFAQQASFRDGEFDRVVDFTKAQFANEHDFSGAKFMIQPIFLESNISPEVTVSGQGEGISVEILIVLGMILLGGGYLLSRKSRNSPSQ